MPAAALVVAALASNRSIAEVSMAMVWTDDRAAGARERGDDVLGGVVSRGARSRPTASSRPRTRPSSAMLVSCFCSSVISLWILALSTPGSRAATSLALDLVDDLDGAVHRRVGDVDDGGAEAERVLDGGQRRRCPTASWWRSTSRRRCRMPRRRGSPSRCGFCVSVRLLLVWVSDCSAVIAATLVLMLLMYISPWEYWTANGTYRGFAGMAERLHALEPPRLRSNLPWPTWLNENALLND